MNCWKLPNGHYLIEGAPALFPTSYVSSICLPDGDILHQASPYYVVTDEGRLIATYGTPHAYSLEDVLYVYDLHAVTHGQLCRFLWQEQWGKEAQTTIVAVLLTGFTECAVHDLPLTLKNFVSENTL
jgi:hypothetical protein